MPPETGKYLYDIKQAAELIAGFTAGKAFADYGKEAMLRAAVEREFEIIGEALSQLSKLDSGTIAKISEHRRIIAFRRRKRDTRFYPYSNAYSSSAMRSCTSSTPTESRIRVSLIPRRARLSAGTEAWVMMAG